MKKYILNISTFLFFIFLISCEPRIGIDFEQWGDHSVLTNVQIFTLQADEHELQEYYENGTLTPARRRVIISTGNATIDTITSTVIVKVSENADLTRAGLIFYHQAEKIIPLDKSPVAGIITDLSEKNFNYQVISSDGIKRDWNIIIQNN
jgi:hypothetical protein